MPVLLKKIQPTSRKLFIVDASPLKEQQTRRARGARAPRAAAAPPPSPHPPLANRRTPPRAKQQRTPSIARPRFSPTMPYTPGTLYREPEGRLLHGARRWEGGFAPSQPTRPFVWAVIVRTQRPRRSVN
jgi:hypothetical protein